MAKDEFKKIEPVVESAKINSPKNKRKKILIIVLVVLLILIVALVILYLISSKNPSSPENPETLQWSAYTNEDNVSFQHPSGTGVFTTRDGQLVPASSSDTSLVITGSASQVGSGSSVNGQSSGGQNNGGGISAWPGPVDVHLSPYQPDPNTPLNVVLNSRVKTLLGDTDPTDVYIAPFPDDQGIFIDNKDPDASFNAGAIFLDGSNIVTVTGLGFDINDTTNVFRRFVGSFGQEEPANGTTDETQSINEPISVYVGGASGSISHYDGNSWTQMNTGITDRIIYGIWGLSDTNIYAVTGFSSSGGKAMILHYNGRTWNPMDLSHVNWKEGVYNPNLYAISGSDHNNIYAVGDSGTILRYDGNSWQRVDEDVTTSQLNTVWVSYPDVYIAGFDGTILHRLDYSNSVVLKDERGIIPVANAYVSPPDDSTSVFHWEKIRFGQSEAYYSIWGTPAYVAISGERYTSTGERNGMVAYCRASDCTFSVDYSAPPFHGIWGDEENNNLYAGAGAYENGTRKFMLLNSSYGLQLGADSKKVISSIWQSPGGVLYLVGYNPDQDSFAVAGLRIKNPTSHEPEVSDVKIWPMSNMPFTVWGISPSPRPFSPILDALTNFGSLITNTAKNLGSKIAHIFSGGTKKDLPSVERQPEPQPNDTGESEEPEEPGEAAPLNEQPITIPTPESSYVTTKTFKVYSQKASMESPLDTGIDLVDGDYLEINASGTWNIGINPYNTSSSECGPDGVAPDFMYDIPETENSIPAMGGLAISIGTMSGGFVPVGSHFTHVITWNGRLYLFCLDYTPQDNSGYITVEVKITKPGSI